MPHPNTTQQGFTLLELMVTVAIAAILLAIAIPSFQATTARAQLTTQTNNFLAAMASARNEAVKNNTRAVLCSSNNGTACNGATWADGWLVFVDANRSSTLDAGDTITKVSQAANGLVVLGRNPLGSSMTFGADGALFVTAANAALLPGIVRVCKVTNALPANQNARDIVISTVGHARVQAPNPAIAAGTCPAP